MKTITVDLSDGAYKILQDAIGKGQFRSESDAIEDLMTGLLFERIPSPWEPGYPAYKAWLDKELIATTEKCDREGAVFLTSDEVRASIKVDRESREP